MNKENLQKAVKFFQENPQEIDLVDWEDCGIGLLIKNNVIPELEKGWPTVARKFGLPIIKAKKIFNDGQELIHTSTYPSHTDKIVTKILEMFPEVNV